MFACIHIPEISLEAIVRGEPDLRGQALAVLEGTPPMLMVMAANEAARQSGIEIRMSREEAGMAMAPAVALRRRSLSQEAAAHAALLDCAHAFSPRVEDAAPDTAILDIAGLEHLFGAPAKIARDLARRASQSGLEVQVAMASNPDAAMHAARGFAGITVVPAGKEAERLGALPVEVLFSSAAGGPGWKINKDALPGPGGQFNLARHEDKDKREILEILERWGVRTLRALAALPARAVAERLGQNGVALQKLARGAGDRPLAPASAPMEFSEAMELEHPVELLEPLGFILARMLEQLVSRLKARALATQELRLRLQLTANAETQPGACLPAHERSLRLPVPMQDAGIFLRLLQLDLKSHPPAGAVVQVWLAAEPTRPRLAQGGLFLPLVPPPERLELVLARISGVVGEGNAGSPELVDTHRPQSFRMRRFAPPAPSQKKVVEKLFSRNARLALRIFRPPLPARVELRGSRPLRFTFLGLRREVLALAGPWRTSGEWWTDCGWARDEWEVVFSDGTYRAYRDLLTGQWWMEGEYD
jgi:protein ImuB